MAEAAPLWTLSHPPGLLGAAVSNLSDVMPGDLVLCGYFCDNLGGGPAGARFLARQIRYASDGDIAPPGVHDLGDLNVFPLEPEKHEGALRQQFDKIDAAGAVPILVGGDRSGLDILARHVSDRTGHAPEIRAPGLVPGDSDATRPVLLAVDLSDGSGAGPDPRLDARTGPAVAPPGRPLGAALFGLAPHLDWSGRAETRLAHDALAALVRRMRMELADAPA